MLRLVVRRSELYATGLAATADEHLRLDDDLRRVTHAVEEARGRGARLGGGAGDLPGRHRQALREQELLGVGFLDLHGASMVRGAPFGGGAPMNSGTVEMGCLAILDEHGQMCRASA